MATSVLNYLNLSALAYIDFNGHEGKTIATLIDDNVIKKDEDLVNTELSALQSPSNPLRSYTLLNFTQNSITGFAAAAFQSPSGEIVFAFRGTETIGDTPIPTLNDGATDATIGLTILPPAQLQDVRDFAQSTVAKLTNNTNISIDDSLQYLRNHNATATGYSLGGGLAQYLTYMTSDLAVGGDYGGIKSVTFNAVGIGQNLLDPDALFRLPQYNSTDHVNSLDWVGNYGLQLGKTVTHIDNSEVDYDKVNFSSLGKMLSVRLRLSRGDITVLEYKQEIENIKESISDGSDGYTVDDTMAVYRGYENVGGKGGGGLLFNFSLHGLNRFLTDNPNEPGTQYELTNTVSDQRLSTKSPRKKIVCPNVKKCSLMPAL